jgi:branched-chain amino acid transport system permease protein
MDLLIGGLAIGAVYSLVALGIVLVYRATGVVNFAQGELVMVGAYCAVLAAQATGSSALEFIAAVGASAFCGLVFFLVTHFLLRGWSHMGVVIGTLGLLILLQSVARYLFTDIPLPAEGWLFGDTNVDLFGVSIAVNSLTILAGSTIVAIGLYVWEKTTIFGRSVLAAAEDPWRAALTGINVRTTLVVSWMMGGALAGFAGLLLGPLIGVFPTMGADLIFPSFIAAILGGFSSVPGAFIGGLLLGIIQTYAVVYLGGAWKEVASFAVLLIILLWRPTGLLMVREARKV